MENPNKTLFDCQQMFRHACAFAEVADMAEAKFCHDTADIEWYSTPATVNSAFACEVFLKTLLAFYGIDFKKLLKQKDRHKLASLFDLLPEDAEERIKQATVLCYGGSWRDAFGFDQLEKISDAFVKWRYSYEQEGSIRVDIGFLTSFRNSLREACCLRLFHMKWDDYIR